VRSLMLPASSPYSVQRLRGRNPDPLQRGHLSRSCRGHATSSRAKLIPATVGSFRPWSGPRGVPAPPGPPLYLCLIIVNTPRFVNVLYAPMSKYWYNYVATRKDDPLGGSYVQATTRAGEDGCGGSARVARGLPVDRAGVGRAQRRLAQHDHYDREPSSHRKPFDRAKASRGTGSGDQRTDVEREHVACGRCVRYSGRRDRGTLPVFSSMLEPGLMKPSGTGCRTRMLSLIGCPGIFAYSMG